MGPRVRRALGIVVTSCAAGACSLGALDGYSDDASGSTSASLAGEGEFEANEPGCGADWVAKRASLTRSTPGHASNGACRMCSTERSDGAEIYAASTAFDLSKAKPGTRVTARAWLRSGRAPAPNSVDIFFSWDNGDGQDHRAASGGGTVGEEWNLHSTTFTVPNDAKGVAFSVHAQTNADACIDFDGVVVEIAK